MKIVNIVAIVTLNTQLDLQLIHERIKGTAFPKQGHWLKMRLPPDNSYIAFYKSGKFLITVQDLDKIDEIAAQVLFRLHSIGINVKIVKVKIHNIVIQITIPLRKSLEAIIVNLNPRKASFEPEQFPALIYKDWGVSFLLFSTGSCIVTGLKDFKDAERVIKRLKKEIGVM